MNNFTNTSQISANFPVILDKVIFILLSILFLILSGFLIFLAFYLITLLVKLKKREKASLEMITLEVKVPKDNEIKIDSAAQMLSSFTVFKKSGFFSFLDVDDTIAFEIVFKNSEIRFYVSAPSKIIDTVEKTIYSYYPSADIQKTEEPNIFTENGKVEFGALVLKKDNFFPLKTYKELPTDPLSEITSALAKLQNDEGAIIQILIRPAGSKWQDEGKSYVASKKKKESNPEEATFKIDQKSLEKRKRRFRNLYS